jgi:hypothetical protein
MSLNVSLLIQKSIDADNSKPGRKHTLSPFSSSLTNYICGILKHITLSRKTRKL